ncbi:hypothetical protein ACH4C2_23410 [Streptomyces sp. NPDC018057]|uniref:hypothetical protein n=1 Tax=unclassified Streptomyces TaxID=2593676 RepID=UPI003793402D
MHEYPGRARATPVGPGCGGPRTAPPARRPGSPLAAVPSGCDHGREADAGRGRTRAAPATGDDDDAVIDHDDNAAVDHDEHAVTKAL